MLDTLSSNYEMQKEQERVNSSLEIRLMQAQINPHLLYNTLDSVMWAMNNDDAAKAGELLVHMSRFFKTSLSRGGDVVTLKSELSLIQSYIEIQRLGRGKSYVLEVDMPEDMLDVELPKLTLQPVVENTVMHGFSGYRDDGRIEITASRDGGRITVRDNGIGMPQDEAERLNRLLNTYPPPKPNHSFGLYNVNRWLKAMFGPQCGIVIKSVLGEYTEVTVSIRGAHIKGHSDD